MENLIDQENRPLGGGPLGRRTKATEAEPTRTRAVLGEISQNIRRQPLRNNGNKPNQVTSADTRTRLSGLTVNRTRLKG